MPIANAYNPNPQSVDKILRQRQTQSDLTSERVLTPTPPPATEPKKNFLLDVQTPDYEDKSFLRKVGEDAAMLAYAIPVGLAQAVTHPIEFAKQAPGAIKQSIKDAADADYYKAHPLLGIVNLAGFVAPVAGAAKSAALKTATRSAMNVGLREGAALGIEEAVMKTALKESTMRTVVGEASKTGKTEMVKEVVRNSLTKSGVAEDIALRVSTAISDNLYSTFSRTSAKLNVMESIAHPVGSSLRLLKGKTDPLRTALFGTPAATAVAKIYGADTVAKNPNAFLKIEQWAEAQVRERGFENTPDNRQRVMQEWTEQNSQWASLTPEERIAHFDNYAKQDLVRLKIHEQTGLDIVTVKALPQNYVDAMVETLKNAPEKVDAKTLMTLMEDTFGNDFKMHTAEITAALAKGGDAKEILIQTVSKFGDARSTISFTKFSPEVQKLAGELEKSGYRIGRAPKNKEVSFVSDVFAGVKEGASSVTTKDVLARRSALGRWIERMGMSPGGIIEGATEFAYRENFTQLALGKLKGNLKAGNVTIPVEKLFEWIDKNKSLFHQSRIKGTLPLRTVFDVKADDLVRAGFDPKVAAQIESISKAALREVPVAVTGMADAVINHIRTLDKGYNGWMGRWYDNYLKVAYKGRYDLSPFFSAQQFVETKLQSAMFLKDVRLVPGGKGLAKIGNWTAQKLSRKVGETAPYLKKIIDEPPIEDVAAVRDDILGTLQKTMIDYTSSPDLIGIQGAAKNGLGTLREMASFEESIRSRNFWYSRFGASSVRMATTFNKALAEKFGMTIQEALAHTTENGQKNFKNPQIVQMMRESTQSVFHYQQGFLTSPLAKTLNVVFFPFRFQAKTIQLTANWMSSLSPASRMVVMNNWVHFANWAGTDEGIEWRRTNRNYLYNILSYVTAYEQLGQGIEAVTKGRLFGGNAGLIGGVPFGFMVNLARELSIIPSDPDQFDPKTGRPFEKKTPREAVSLASLSVALEQLVISVMPSTPFYSLTGGMISGISPSKLTTPLIRSVLGSTREKIEGGNPDKGRQMLERDFMRVPAEYTRLGE